MLGLFRTRRSRTAAPAVAALTLGVALVGASLGGSASAAPAAPNLPADAAPAGDDFYVPPASIPADAKPGDILRWRPSKAGPPTARSLANAWQVMYVSQDALGKPDAVTGTILVPKSGDAKTLPIVGFGPGTSGPAFRCAPSKFIDEGAFYEQAAVNGMLKAGYAVAMTDYEGYHPDPKMTYIAGKSMGSAVIDSVRAAQRFSEAGLSADAKVLFRGYSQGGGAAMWAGQMQPDYAPELKLVGVAGGGVPADLTKVAVGLNSKRGFGFLMTALVGLDNAYPELKLSSYFKDDGQQVFSNMVANDCTLELLTNYAGHKTTDYLTKSPFLDAPWLARVKENLLGGTAIKAPVFHYHGTNDDIVPFAQDDTLHQAYCKLGVQETWKTYPVDHITGVGRANDDVLAFMASAVKGEAPSSNCSA
ncbi:lipase family protein [Actinomadura atramentaria]|uniref:lipase family protein n=1 Tax=Actinomadura atramentaria TaxID=1990 RepID=UPI00035DF63E|nr:lipase family protein [Actinomadura atramentaria]